MPWYVYIRAYFRPFIFFTTFLELIVYKVMKGYPLHNVQKCGSPKRAVAPSSEWA